MRVGSVVGATLIYGAGFLASDSIGGDVGTNLGYELGMVGSIRDWVGAVAWRMIWATWMNAFLVV